MSDLYREKCNETHYEVDGKWREFKVVEEKVGNQTFKVKITHRGPVVTAELIKGASSLFGTKIPVPDDSAYSLTWSGAMPRETFFSFIDGVLGSKSFVELG